MPPRRQSAAEVLAADVTERELQTQVLELARLLGWRPYHTHDSRRSHKGYPDLTLVRRADHRPGRVMWVELKSEKGRVRPEQQEWLDDLNSVPGVVAMLVRPSGLEALAAELAR